MMNGMILGLLSLLSVSAPGAIGGGGPVDEAQPLGTSCSGVEIKVTNEHATYDYINVLRIEYRVPGGTWHTEGLANEMLGQGEDHTWNDQNLQDASEGSYLNFRVYFQRIDIYNPNVIYGEEFQFFDKSSKQCTDGHNYNFVIR